MGSQKLCESYDECERRTGLKSDVRVCPRDGRPVCGALFEGLYESAFQDAKYSCGYSPTVFVELAPARSYHSPNSLAS